MLVPIWRRILVMGGLGTRPGPLRARSCTPPPAIRPPSTSAIFRGAVPVFVLIFGLVAFGTRIGLLQALGTALTLGGVGAIAARGDLQVLRSFSFLIGDVFMLIACASYAVYTLALRDRPKVSGFVFFSVLALAALMISLPLLRVGDRRRRDHLAGSARLCDPPLCDALSLAPVADLLHARRRAHRAEPGRPCSSTSSRSSAPSSASRSSANPSAGTTPWGWRWCSAGFGLRSARKVRPKELSADRLASARHWPNAET